VTVTNAWSRRRRCTSSRPKGLVSKLNHKLVESVFQGQDQKKMRRFFPKVPSGWSQPGKSKPSRVYSVRDIDYYDVALRPQLNPKPLIDFWPNHPYFEQSWTFCAALDVLSDVEMSWWSRKRSSGILILINSPNGVSTLRAYGTSEGPGLDQGAAPSAPRHLSSKFSRRIALVRCPCAFRLRRLTQNGCHALGLRLFTCNFLHN
jgi:hypothetical protein